jgi:hypothetical protein
MNGFPEPFCCCCTCQGIRCLLDHPGHNHRVAWRHTFSDGVVVSGNGGSGGEGSVIRVRWRR